MAGNKVNLSNLSDDELERIASGASVGPKSNDFSKMSDEELEKLASGPPKSKPLEAAGAGAANALTFGYAPQIGAAIAPVIDKGINLVTGLRTPDDTYVQRRDENIKRENELADSNPLAYGSGQIAGSLASTAIPAGLASKLGLLGNAKKAIITAEQAEKLTRAEKALAAGKRIAQGAATGASFGLIANPGDTEGQVSPLQLDERVENAKSGAAIGGAVTGGVEGLAALGKLASGKAKSFAENRAFKALGPSKADTTAANTKGNLREIGRTLLDEQVVTPFATPKTIVARLEGKIDDATAAIDGAIEKIQAGSSKVGDLKPEQAAKLSASFFRPKDVAANLKQQILDRYDQIPKNKLEPALNEIDNWFADKPEIIKIGDLQKFKKQMNTFLKDSDFYKPLSEQSFAKQGTLAVRRGVKEGIEKQGDTVSEMLGGKGGEIKSANKKLGQFLESADIAQDKINRDMTNRSLSLTDYLAILSGGQGGPLQAIATGAANKFGRTFGNSLMATSADQISKRLMKVPQFAELATKNPIQFQALVNKVAIGQENQSAETAMQRRLREAK